MEEVFCGKGKKKRAEKGILGEEKRKAKREGEKRENTTFQFENSSM